jgi:GNAT superfamily N-acetyltransferase
VSATVRRYRDSDHGALYDICVRTAAGGQDARGMYHSDDLMPDLFAGPYAFLEPDFAFVLDDGGQGGGQAVGYVVGTPDTAAFARAYRERWIPRLAGRYAQPPQPPVTPDDQMLALHYRPERLLWPGLAEYPAHLHIDLLPPFQGAGHGRRLMGTFFAAAAQAGAAGVHVCVVAANVRAIGFYHRLGFVSLADDEAGGVVYLGLKLPAGTGITDPAGSYRIGVGESGISEWHEYGRMGLCSREIFRFTVPSIWGRGRRPRSAGSRRLSPVAPPRVATGPPSRSPRRLSTPTWSSVPGPRP